MSKCYVAALKSDAGWICHCEESWEISRVQRPEKGRIVLPGSQPGPSRHRGWQSFKKTSPCQQEEHVAENSTKSLELWRLGRRSSSAERCAGSAVLIWVCGDEILDLISGGKGKSDIAEVCDQIFMRVDVFLEHSESGALFTPVSIACHSIIMSREQPTSSSKSPIMTGIFANLPALASLCVLSVMTLPSGRGR